MSSTPIDEQARQLGMLPNPPLGPGHSGMGGQPPPPLPGENGAAGDGSGAPGDLKIVRASRWEKRKGRPLWLRLRILVLLAAIWGVLFWYTLTNPLVSVRDGLVMTWNSKWWLTVLFGLELVRQVHYVLSEHWGWWNHFWADVVFGRIQGFGHFSEWGKYRAKRLVFWLIFIVVLAAIAGAAQHTNPINGVFQLPGKLVSVLGYLAYVVFILVIAVGQFAAIFWFLSRGGVETYYPDDVKTRFNHVWGQDAVLERIKENLVFLEDPQSIESRGGYVPGGLLLWGPPGTGKTLMAEAVAGETGKPFVFVEPSAFINMFMGVGALKVKSLFRKLRKLATRYGGVIVFFDEADSLGNRGVVTGGGIFGPGGVQGMSEPGPWAVGDCHGGSYLSEPGVNALIHAWRGSTADASSAPDGRRGWRDRMFVGAGMGGGGMGGMGTLQALLAEMSGLQKPRGFMNRVVRRALGMKMKPPVKYRMLIMMATNMPNSLDEALLRPGRIDRIYRVGYPSKAGRVRTYQGYFAKVQHQLTDADMDKLATITPYATGATIKDLVNESLIVSLRHKHEAITWSDVLEAKRLKDLGPPEDVEYVERERHAVAVHEACHAVIAYRVRKHLEIDLATIEKGQTYLGMVSSIKPEDRFTSWRSEYEADVMVALASLAGERLFFAGDSSSGVSGDLETATMIAGLMESYWGMGSSVASQGARRQSTFPGQGGNDLLGGDAGKKVEDRLHDLLDQTRELLENNRVQVFAVAHALESHKTLSGEDVEAVVEGKQSRGVDGRVYAVAGFMEVYGAYHDHLVEAHVNRVRMAAQLPQPAQWAPELVNTAVSNGDGDGHWPAYAGELAPVAGPAGSADGGWGSETGGAAGPPTNGGGWGAPGT